MASTINDLYLKYVNDVESTLEQDRYFQYLFEMVQAGSNTISQQHQIMHKVVDERWLATIEESLEAINNIIEKPRRFVTTNEEVVPVALAKKISADSVRHLSMNTQFIASSEDGEIHPTRILNVSTEESYDLYENRFIYHLIQRLVTFIDKRTDVIFWSTADETKNVLTYQSKVDDAYEEIEYKIEMTVKNRQSFAENDSDNMQVFMRIDRVRRMVMALRNSAFCSLMAGCSKVRSPIQRTNLMMKDPNYRTCYKLWQFLENYDEVGYSIEVQNSALEFDEEYMIQLYINLITSYTVFKSLLEADPRRLEEVAAQKLEPIKPKFIKKIEEQIVDNYDLEDVEIRQVIIEEVTQAQLDAEARLLEEQEVRRQLEEDLEQMDSQMMGLQQQIMTLMEMSQQAEERAYEEQQAKETALAEKEAETRAKEAEIQAKEAERQAREAAEQRESAERDNRVAAENRIQELQHQMEELQTAQQKAMETAQHAEAVRAEIQQKMQELQEQAQLEVASAQEDARKQVEEIQEKTRRQVEEIQENARKQVEEIQKNARKQVEKLQEDTRKQVEEIREDACRRIEVTKEQAQQQISEAAYQAERAQAEAERCISDKQLAEQEQEKARRARADAETKTSEALRRAAEAQRIAADAKEALRAEQERAASEARAREKIQAQAEANKLSKYIISVLNERRRKNENTEDD